MKPRLNLAVSNVVQQKQGRIEENLFGLRHADPMFVILSLVAHIPFKADDG
jgi:hypothetical protein